MPQSSQRQQQFELQLQPRQPSGNAVLACRKRICGPSQALLYTGTQVNRMLLDHWLGPAARMGLGSVEPGQWVVLDGSDDSVRVLSASAFHALYELTS